QVDPALFAGRSLYLRPDGPAARHPYAVLAEALRRRRRWGLGRLALHGRRRPAMVRPADGLLAVHLLHYPELLRAADGEPAGGPAGTAAELDLACRLIDAASPAVAP